MSDAIEWMPARDALNMLWKMGGSNFRPGGTALEVSIAQIACTPGNKLRTKAASVTVEGEEIDLTDSEGCLPPSFWEPDAIRVFNKSSSNWGLGIVAGEAVIRGEHLRAIAHGVMFCRDDLERLTGAKRQPETKASPSMSAPAPAPDAALPNRGGKPRDVEKWDAVTVAIARLANEGRLDRAMDSRFQTQAALRSAILDDPDVAALGVADETIKPLARKVWKAFLE